MITFQVCGKGFCHRQSLITHNTLHTGVKPYQCDNCGHAFSCVGNLIKHRKMHADTCGTTPLTTHTVNNPVTRMRVKLNTPENSKLTKKQREKEVREKVEAYKEKLKEEGEGFDRSDQNCLVHDVISIMPLEYTASEYLNLADSLGDLNEELIKDEDVREELIENRVRARSEITCDSKETASGYHEKQYKSDSLVKDEPNRISKKTCKQKRKSLETNISEDDIKKFVKDRKDSKYNISTILVIAITALLACYVTSSQNMTDVGPVSTHVCGVGQERRK